MFSSGSVGLTGELGTNGDGHSDCSSSCCRVSLHLGTYRLWNSSRCLRIVYSAFLDLALMMMVPILTRVVRDLTTLGGA